jgi:hypothetical protein
VHDVEVIVARLRDARSVPELLATSFDAFEAIRVLARSSEDKVPSLFAAFMSAADAAVDGRQAITIAPSLSPAPTVTPIVAPPGAGADIETITVALAALGELLDECLAGAADRAQMPDDRAACQEAAAAGRRIRQLMARENDDRHLR